MGRAVAPLVVLLGLVVASCSDDRPPGATHAISCTAHPIGVCITEFVSQVSPKYGKFVFGTFGLPRYTRIHLVIALHSLNVIVEYCHVQIIDIAIVGGEYHVTRTR